MTFRQRCIAGLALPACMLVLTNASGADWAQSPNPMVVSPAPKNLSVQRANPPTFTWARHPASPATYVVEVRSGGGVYKTYSVNRNWLLPPEKFAAGTYTWRVCPQGNSSDCSDARTFTIDSTTRDFVVPNEATLRSMIAAKPHPRSIQSSVPVFSRWSPALKAERASALAKMRTEVEWFVSRLAYPKDSNWPLPSTVALTPATVAQATAVRQSIYANGRQLEAAALLFRLTGEQQYLTEAISRADAFANLNVSGPTSYENQDQGARVIALGLARTLDLLSGSVDSARRTRWLAVIDRRTTAMYTDLAGSNGRMDQYPFDSHGGTNLAYLALIAALTLGDIPNATTWFDFAFRASVASTSVWSGPEGGFSNGTAYAEYTAEVITTIWQPLGIITGINIFDKPWTRGFANFLMQFVPPGSTRHVFGDGHEEVPGMRVHKGFAAQYDNPQAAWYYRAIREDMDALTLLQAQHPLPVSKIYTAVPPSNASIFPSIGWTAMHSDIAKNNRTSVYFKSSPYGSFNHSHADQNSFVVMKGGKALLSEAGYMDYYGSPLSENWYRQSKAHNTITYDGGKGQVMGGYTAEGYNKQMMYTGRLTAFSTTANLDYVEGDATPTYDGALTKAVRKLWYLRSQDAIVILDQLEAPVARRFEWNMHSLARMAFESDTKTVNVTDATGEERVCVRPILSAPDFGLEQRTGATPRAGTVEDHAAFVSSAQRLKQEFMILIDIGCKRPRLTLSATSTTRTLTVGKQSITLPR